MPSSLQTNRISFDQGWKCHEGELQDQPKRIVAKAASSCYAAELTQDETPAGANLNVLELMTQMGGGQLDVVKWKDLGSGWEEVTLPHDWRIRKPVAPDHPVVKGYPSSYQGFYPTGLAYYRKTFMRTLSYPEERVHITFEGVVGRSDFWMNGWWLGSNATSYSPVSFDITELLRDDDQGGNVFLVRTDNAEAEGWWYEGGGISRHVWIESHHNVHVDRHGCYITTPEISHETASVKVALDLTNDGISKVVAGSVKVAVEILDDQEKVISEEQTDLPELSSLGQAKVVLRNTIGKPKLWNIGQGNLYVARVSLKRDGKAIFTQDYSFGVRKLEFVKDGILINGEWHKILGTNIHTDAAVVGIAVPDRLLEAKLELLREMGTNTVRTAHHPPTSELVAHADRLGMLILAENRLLSTAPHQIASLHTLVRQFRSHPSILLWSLENEEMSMEGTKLGANVLRRLAQQVNALDPTRQTTAGGVINVGSDYFKEVDVIGMHYQGFFNGVKEAVDRIPEGIYLQDESGCLLPSSRGVYHEKDETPGHNSAFTKMTELEPVFLSFNQFPMLATGDIGARDNIATCQTEVFKSPLTTGGCVWTGMDYHGEPIPNKWPSVVSPYGARDLVGLPKDYYWLLRALFKDEPCVHAFPHWTWPGSESEKIPFRVYSNCDEVEVFVNDKSVGRVAVESSAAYFPDGLTYEPGSLTVKGLKGGVAVTEHRQSTAGKAAKLELIADRSTLCADGSDIATVRVSVVDANGVLVPNAEPLVNFSVKGGGQIIGVGNGDNATTESAHGTSRHAFRGCAATYIQAGAEAGTIELSAEVDGLQSSTISIALDADTQPHQAYAAMDESVSPAGQHVVY